MANQTFKPEDHGLIRPKDFGAHLTAKQGERSESQFERDTKVVRQTLRPLKSGETLPTPNILDRLGYDMFYREREAKPAKKAK